MSFNQYKRVLGSGTSYLSTTDLFVEVNTLLGVATIYLPKISELFDLSSVNNIYNFNGIRFTDLANNAAINNIILKGKDGDLVNGLFEITLDTNGVGGILTPISETGWSLTINNIAISSGGTIIGGGTLNYVAKFTPDGITINNSLLYDNGTSVGIGTNIPDASALLDLTSTTQGFAAPRMTTLQRDAIVAPIVSLLIFNTSSGFYNYWDGSAWIQMDTSTGGDVSGSGTTNYAVKWTDGVNSVIGDGTWYFSGNDYLPVTTGSNIGDATHRIGTVFMASIFDYANDLNFYNGTSNTMTLTTSGNLGIGGNFNPLYPLHIRLNTDENVLFRSYDSGFGSMATFQTVNNAASLITPINFVSSTYYFTGYQANMWIGDAYLANPTARVHIKGTDSTSANYALKVDNLISTPLLYVRNDGNVGINQLSPLYKLDVNGGVNANGYTFLQSGFSSFSIESSYKLNAVFAEGFRFHNLSYNFLNYIQSGTDGDIFNIANSFIRIKNSGIGDLTKYFSVNVSVTPSAMMHIQGIDSTSANYVLKADNTSTNLFSISNNGIYTFSSILDGESSGNNNYVFSTSSGGIRTGYYGNTGYGSLFDYFTNNVLGSQTQEYSGYYITRVKNFWSIRTLLDNKSHLFMDASSGYVGVGDDGFSPTATFHVKGINSTSANYAVKFDNSLSAPLLYVRNDGNIGIGISTPATSALLDLTSTTGALLVPRMTTVEKMLLTAVNGMIIYDTTLNKFQGYENGAWANLI